MNICYITVSLVFGTEAILILTCTVLRNLFISKIKDILLWNSSTTGNQLTQGHLEKNNS